MQPADWTIPTSHDPFALQAVHFSALTYSKVGSRVFLQTARQYHSLCMLGFWSLYNVVASLAIVRVIHSHGKLKISFAIL